ncbi:class I SAM-dependent methyltransferase [Methylobacterium sp. A54F]
MNPLGVEIATLIRETGPIGIDRYMALCLGHPVHGYYRTRDPLGARGDFTTAPEISQMFGELIGIWVAAVTAMMGVPARLNLLELGPGRGTLMSDALRALRVAARDTAFDLHLVETSPILRAAQAQALAASAPHWHTSPETLPDGPMLVVANEFIDCLPVRQFARRGGLWFERVVGLDAEGRLTFGLAPEPTRALTAEAPEGVLMTLPGAALDLTRRLAAQVAARGGAMLLIDYGHATPGFGDTLQALSRHRFADPLAAPGEADLTVHVDFPALARAATGAGAVVQGPVEQRDFLFALGLRERAARLKAGAGPEQSAAIDAAVARLTSEHVGDPEGAAAIDAVRPGTGMGRLFKVMAVSAPGLGALPGFAPAAG